MVNYEAVICIQIFLSLWIKCKLSPLTKYVRISNNFYQNESCLLLEHS